MSLRGQTGLSVEALRVSLPALVDDADTYYVIDQLSY